MTVSSVRDGVTLIYAFLIIIIITRVIHPTLQDILEHYRQQIRFGITPSVNSRSHENVTMISKTVQELSRDTMLQIYSNMPSQSI